MAVIKLIQEDTRECEISGGEPRDDVAYAKQLTKIAMQDFRIKETDIHIVRYMLERKEGLIAIRFFAPDGDQVPKDYKPVKHHHYIV